MANENMIKFLRGNVAGLPQTATAGALYFTKDEGIYMGMEDGSYHRYGDFITVADVNSLPATGAHATCMYYCTKENILARYDSEKGWIQINKQPTADEMKVLLGLGSMAYKSEVVESDLSAALKEKVNAAAEGNHSHSNKALLDTYTQTEANLADAVAKKHTHANADELAKIADGDKAKWDAVAADHLTSADKTALENSIKEAKKAGTDANTALETYKVSNDARVKAVEDDVAEIVDGTNGILAQAKSYVDGKDSAMNTRVAAIEAAAPTHALKTEVEAVDAKFASYNTTVAQKAIDDAQDAEIAKKVDKVEGKSLIADSEIARLATLANYDDTQVKADIAKKADADTMATELGKKVDKVSGKDLIATSEIERLATLKNYDDTALVGRVTTAEGKITALETESAKHALKTDVEAEFAKYTKTADLPTDLGDFTNNAGYAKTADVNTELNKKADKTQVATDIANAVAPLATTEALNGVKATAEAAAVKTEVEAALALKADKSDVEGDIAGLQEQITANANAITVLTEGIDPDKIDGLTDLVNWANTHAPEVESIKADIEANEKAIADHETLAAQTYETKTDASAKLAEAKEHADGVVATEKAAREAADAELAAAIEAAKTAAVNQDAVVLVEAQNYANTAKTEAIADAASKYEVKGTAQGIVDGLKLSETYEPIGAEDRAVAAAEGKVNALAATVYTKDEVNAAIAAAVEAAHTWGSF